MHASLLNAARSRDVDLGLLHQVAAEGLGNDAPLVEVLHELGWQLHNKHTWGSGMDLGS